MKSADGSVAERIFRGSRHGSPAPIDTERPPHGRRRKSRYQTHGQREDESARLFRPRGGLSTGLDKTTTYAGYLVNVYHYARHSPQVISLAASRAVQSNREPAAYLMHHGTEEIGHEQWASSDLSTWG